MLSLQGIEHLTKVFFLFLLAFPLEVLVYHLSEPPLALTVESLLIPSQSRFKQAWSLLWARGKSGQVCLYCELLITTTALGFCEAHLRQGMRSAFKTGINEGWQPPPSSLAMKLVVIQEHWLAFNLHSQMVTCPSNVWWVHQGRVREEMGPFHPREDGAISPRRSFWYWRSYTTWANRLWGKDFWGVFWHACRKGCCSLKVRVGTCSVAPWQEKRDCSQGNWGMVIWTVSLGSYASLHPVILSSNTKYLSGARIKKKKIKKISLLD